MCASRQENVQAHKEGVLARPHENVWMQHMERNKTRDTQTAHEGLQSGLDRAVPSQSHGPAEGGGIGGGMMSGTWWYPAAACSIPPPCPIGPSIAAGWNCPTMLPDSW
mmetsp:Transcript_24726/g.61091  ORF Transcript_24726/g.61091 Transcript_24726/m.61091 type:complete len:108 (-) Transcript_24726:180-503(-)